MYIINMQLCIDKCTPQGERIARSKVQRCLTSTETVRTIRDGEPRTATSTFTQLLTSGLRVGRLYTFFCFCLFFVFVFKIIIILHMGILRLSSEDAQHS